MYLLTEREGRMEKDLALGHGIRTSRFSHSVRLNLVNSILSYDQFGAKVVTKL